MVDIKPFRAIRYAAERIDDLSSVIAPPYDVISSTLQAELYARHDKNIIRVDLNREEPGDQELSRYERAGKFLNAWLAEGTMTKDPAPTFYVLAQTFVGPDGIERTRTGFFGRATLTRFGEGPIIPHERTLKGPKLDRLRLFRATKTNLSPIFGIYRDPEEEVLEVLSEVVSGHPLTETRMDGVVNRMYRADNADQRERIRRALADKRLYIADGHHRYETGLAYRDERRQAAATPDPEAGYESILMFSAAVEDPGMVVFPTHRLVHSLPSFGEEKMLAELQRFFDATELSKNDPPAFVDALRVAGTSTNALGVVTAGHAQILQLKDRAPLDEVPELPRHPMLRRLDVALLHGVVLEHLLGISREAQATQQNLRYSKDNTEAFHAPDIQNEVQAAFLMNATKIQEVIEVSDAAEVMPQKSTFFYPKIPSGLVLYPLD